MSATKSTRPCLLKLTLEKRRESETRLRILKILTLKNEFIKLTFKLQI